MTLKAVAEDIFTSVYLGFYRIPLYNWRITPYTLSCTLSYMGYIIVVTYCMTCLTADSMSTHYVLPLYSFLIKSAIVLESSTTTGRATIVAYPRLRNYSRAEVFHNKGLISSSSPSSSGRPYFRSGSALIGSGSVGFLFRNSSVYYVFHVLTVLSFRSTPHCLEYLTIARLFPDSSAYLAI